ncbi:MAG: cupin domain-containing protein [Bacteroidales bacterium]|nr:cupin domain-containing protein [Bacteroidales bacterium]
MHDQYWFLIPSGVKTKFHKIKSDELWFFHSGNPISIECIDDNNLKTQISLSNEGSETTFPSGVVKAGIWFASESLSGKDDYSLVSCAVAPGFNFKDFQLKSVCL